MNTLAPCFSFVLAVAIPLSLAADTRADERQQALSWLDQFRESQVLFADSDLEKLRGELAASSPDEAQRWWENTERSRNWLASDEWQETHTWFRNFLRVQAILSDQEIAELRARAFTAFQASPTQFRDVLEEVHAQRERLARGAVISARAREQRLAAYQRFRVQFEETRGSARQTARVPTAPDQREAARRRDYQPAPPLISSMTMARWVVRRSIWRR